MPVLECSRCNELFYSASGTNSTRCERCGGNVWRVFDDEASFDRVAARPRRSQPGDHLAVVYSDPQEAADFCAKYVREGLGRGEVVVAVLPETLAQALDRRLSDRERNQVQVADPRVAYADFDPHTLIAWYEGVVHSSDADVRVLAGPDGDSAAQISLDDWRLFEQLIHDRVHELGVTGLCVYDGPSLPGEFMSLAMRAHPLLVMRSGDLLRNPEFRYDGPAPPQAQAGQA
jgi:predicted  nucleic acid-binding Zn-ribbon protein